MSQKTAPISSGYLAGYNSQSANAVAIGNNAGSFSQGTGSVAIGFQAGQYSQGANSMAIGYQAGVNGQGSASFAMGYQAGFVSQGNNALAIGYGAGQTGQGSMAESIGYGAGQFAQGTGAIAIGYMAGNTGQGAFAEAIGYQAGASLQGANALALGYMAGVTGQSANATAAGYMAGAYGQNANTVAFGYMAGTTGQGTGAFAMGFQAGNWNQGQNAIAMGFQAGMTGQGAGALAVGFQAGEFSQGQNAIAMGTNAGMTGQGANALAVGANAGLVSQGAGAIAFGASAGQFSQGANALAMGYGAGMTGQKANAVAVGYGAGQSIQGDNAFAMGYLAGNTGQGQNAVAIGNQAGQLGQGVNGMAVGYQAGMTGQKANAMAVGYGAGQSMQSDNAFAMGYLAGNTGQGTGAFAMGFQAGNFGQGVNAMAVGFQAGMTGQKSGALALGYGAGMITQGANAMAVGYGAGMFNQGDNGFAVGYQAGVTGQGTNTLAMGYQAGSVLQGAGALAVGYQAGMTGQGANAVAIGFQAGMTGQGAGAIALGYQAGATGQGTNASAIGYQAGQFYQGQNSVAMGFQAGMTGQGQNSVAIGNFAGNVKQTSNAFALGSQAGQTNQGSGAMGLGVLAGQNNQGDNAFAAGGRAGMYTQGVNAFAIGSEAGKFYQGAGAFAGGVQAGFTGQNANAAAIGYQAGMYTQGTGAFALGYQAGMTGQGLNAVALGYQAGQSTQGNFAVAVGNLAGVTGQNTNAVAIGNFAGQYGQGAGSVAIGYQAGVTGQKSNTVAIGNSAGQFNQGANALAVGFGAGMTGQNDNAMALGNSAGQFAQGTGAFAAGYQAGMTGQSATALALGYQAGALLQGTGSVAIGSEAGEFSQGANALAVGLQAGQFTQGVNALAIGYQAGMTGQSANALALGFQAGALLQGTGAFAIGAEAGEFNQGVNALAIGNRAGMTGQNATAFAIGYEAGASSQGTGAFAIGYRAGMTGQGINAGAIGYGAGQFRQGAGAVAIGYQAGYTGQGANSIAIGNQAGVTGITANSIVLNASGTGFFATGPTGAFYVSPVSTVADSGMIKGNILVYGENNQIMKTPATIDKDGGFFYTNLTQLSDASNVSSLTVSDGRVQTALTTFAAGNNAGTTGQNQNSVAIGMNAGQYYQGTGSVSIGYQAGQINLLSTTTPITSGKNMCMSGNGQYQLVASATLMLSTNAGLSFTTSNVVGTPDSIAMSASGQYMLVSTIASPNTIYLSTNYGVSWNSINSLLTSLFNTSVNSAILSSPSVVGISGSTMIITSNLTSFQSIDNGSNWLISKQMVTQYFPFDGNVTNMVSGTLSLTAVNNGYSSANIGINSASFTNSATNTLPTSYMYSNPLSWTWNTNLTFTISCRFLVSTGFTSNTSGSVIWGIGKAGGNNTFLTVYKNSSNTLSIKLVSSSQSANNVSIGGDINTITSNRWYYAVATLKSGVFTFYLDGTIIGQSDVQNSLNTPPINRLSIGACINTISPDAMYTDANGSSGFSGCIDDFRIYEGVDIGLELTQDISTTTRLLNNVSNSYPIQMYTPGIYPSFLACINADADTLTLANGSTGIVIIDSTLRFSGTNSYKFSSGGTKSTSIALPSSFTISCVLRFTSGIASSVPFALVNSNDPSKSLELFMTSGGSFSVATGSSPSSATIISTGCAPPINTWYYIAITVSSAGVNLYINGFPNGTYTTSNSVTSAIYGNTVNLVLGALNTSGSNAFNGNIDDFRIYNGVLSQAQIGLIYTDMSYITPAYYASFDGGNATLLNGYFPSTAGSGIYSGDDTTKISGNYSLRVNPSGVLSNSIDIYGFSISFWLRFNTLQNRNYSFPFLIAANSVQPNLSVCERFGKLYLRYYSASASPNEQLNPPDGNGMVVATATWYHITLVNDYATANLYVNGALLGNINCGVNNWNIIYINRTSAAENFDGWIDEYKFYQASLSSYQVKELYGSYKNNTYYNFKNTSYSSTASYQLYTNLSNKVYVSTDSGSTSTQIVSSTSNYTAPVFSLCMSSTGQYMAFCTTKELYYSSNYGTNWTILKILTGADTFKSVALYENGVYLSALYSSGIYVNPLSGPNSIAIGYQAGQIYQGSNSIAIGNQAGKSYQPFNSIIINANDTALNAYTPNGCFIVPIASFTNSTSTTFDVLGYGTDNQIVRLGLNVDASGICGVNSTGSFYLPNAGFFMSGARFNATQGGSRYASGDIVIFNNASGTLNSPQQIQIRSGNSLKFWRPDEANSWETFISAGSNYTIRQNGGYEYFLSGQQTNAVWNYNSDERLKENIQPAPSYLETVLSIPVKTFNYKKQPETACVGFIAQDIQKLPQLLDIVCDSSTSAPDGTPYLALGDGKFMPYLIKAFQEQHAIITDLKTQLASLKATVDALAQK